MKHNIGDLYQMQSLPLQAKISMTIVRVRGWLDHWDDDCYISFSGGKDSTVLVDIVYNKMGRTDIPLVFVDTGLEYPEIREFVRSYGDRVVWLKPEMNFRQVVEKFGYPMISKDISQCLYDVNTQAKRLNCSKRETRLWNRAFNPDSEYAKKYPGFSRARYDFMNDSPYAFSHRCCDIMKKKPSKMYEKQTGRKPILATMACESRLRQTQWLQDGCNAFNVKRPTSKPMSFWKEQDVLEYIKKHQIPICSVYGDIVEDNSRNDNLDGQMRFDDLSPDLWSDELEQPKLKTTGCNRTGCMFCGFGCHVENENSFERMKKTHPKQYEWIMKPWNEGGWVTKKLLIGLTNMET